jgi:hypothetical protein
VTHDAAFASKQDPPSDDSAPDAIDRDVRRLAATVLRLANDPENLAQLLPDMLHAAMSQRAQHPSKDDVRTFIESGGFTSDEWAEISAAVDRESLQFGETAAWLTGIFDTMSIADAAALLGWEEELVQIAVAAGQLYGIEVSGRIRLPIWQFNRGSPTSLLDRLPELLRAFNGRRWSSVVGFMKTEHRDLVARGRRTPGQWLLAGGDIDDVIQIVLMSDWGRKSSG